VSRCAEDSGPEAVWELHNEEFRDPAEIVSCWQDASRVDPRLLRFRTEGAWWETLLELRVTLLVSREYEHLLLSLTVDATGSPVIGLMRMPHPSGIAVDRTSGVVHVASTRNPNQIFDLMPLESLMPRLDVKESTLPERFLVPVRTRFLPGCFYLHDLAMVDGELHANSVGQNAVVRLRSSGGAELVWWPKCIEGSDGPVFGQNHLQLNSIAAGDSLDASYFSASTDEMTALRPGDPDFPVDRRGVIFSGASREPIARGLTRPHSARLRDGRLWVDDSGYGAVGIVEDGTFRSVTDLPGWTRGLAFCDRVMFVGTSRVLPRFSHYAPGLDPETAQCGLHAIDCTSGAVVGSMFWPYGSQIFSVECVPADFTVGFPFRADGTVSEEQRRVLFYSFQMPDV
jgi:uncharacterized protein (TIGR03032 family)